MLLLYFEKSCTNTLFAYNSKDVRGENHGKFHLSCYFGCICLYYLACGVVAIIRHAYSNIYFLFYLIINVW